MYVLQVFMENLLVIVSMAVLGGVSIRFVA